MSPPPDDWDDGYEDDYGDNYEGEEDYESDTEYSDGSDCDSDDFHGHCWPDPFDTSTDSSSPSRSSRRSSADFTDMCSRPWLMDTAAASYSGAADSSGSRTASSEMVHPSASSSGDFRMCPLAFWERVHEKFHDSSSGSRRHEVCQCEVHGDFRSLPVDAWAALHNHFSTHLANAHGGSCSQAASNVLPESSKAATSAGPDATSKDIVAMKAAGSELGGEGNTPTRATVAAPQHQHAMQAVAPASPAWRHHGRLRGRPQQPPQCIEHSSELSKATLKTTTVRRSSAPHSAAAPTIPQQCSTTDSATAVGASASVDCTGGCSADDSGSSGNTNVASGSSGSASSAAQTPDQVFSMLQGDFRGCPGGYWTSFHAEAAWQLTHNTSASSGSASSSSNNGNDTGRTRSNSDDTGRRSGSIDPAPPLVSAPATVSGAASSSSSSHWPASCYSGSSSANTSHRQLKQPMPGAAAAVTASSSASSSTGTKRFPVPPSRQRLSSKGGSLFGGGVHSDGFDSTVDTGTEAEHAGGLEDTSNFWGPRPPPTPPEDIAKPAPRRRSAGSSNVARVPPSAGKLPPLAVRGGGNGGPRASSCSGVCADGLPVRAASATAILHGAEGEQAFPDDTSATAASLSRGTSASGQLAAGSDLDWVDSWSAPAKLSPPGLEATIQSARGDSILRFCRMTGRRVTHRPRKLAPLSG